MANVAGYDPDASNKKLMSNLGNLAGTAFEIGLMFAGPAMGLGKMGTMMLSQGGRALAGGMGAESFLDPRLSALMSYTAGEEGWGQSKPPDQPRIEGTDYGQGPEGGPRTGGMEAGPQAGAGAGAGSIMPMYSRILSGRIGPVGTGGGGGRGPTRAGAGRYG